MLHAAALDGREAADLYRWALNPTAAVEAATILQSDSQAADGWADSLAGMIHADPRTRDSIWHGVSLAFNALADPRVLAAVTPRSSKNEERSTCWPPAPEPEPQPHWWPRSSKTSPKPPDDSRPPQARDKWGDHQANAIWDASIVKVILGGASNSRDLQDLTTLIGERDEHTDSTSIDHYGGRSHQRSIRRVPIMSPDVLRTLPFGTGVVLLRTTRPIITALRPWTRRPDAQALQRERNEIEQRLRAKA